MNATQNKEYVRRNILRVIVANNVTIANYLPTPFDKKDSFKAICTILEEFAPNNGVCFDKMIDKIRSNGGIGGPLLPTIGDIFHSICLDQIS